jgi:hypothetical protein
MVKIEEDIILIKVKYPAMTVWSVRRKAQIILGLAFFIVANRFPRQLFYSLHI